MAEADNEPTSRRLTRQQSVNAIVLSVSILVVWFCHRRGGETDWRAFGLTMALVAVTSVIVNLLDRWATRDSMAKEWGQQLRTLFPAESLDIASLARGGVVSVYSEFPVHRFRELSRRARRIRILQTWIQDPHNKLQCALENNRDGVLQILVADPQSRFAGLRQESFRAKTGSNVDIVQQHAQLSGTIALFANNQDALLSRLEVRHYDAIAGVSMYVCDDTMIVGFHLEQVLSESGTHIELQGGLQVFERFEKHFDRLWAASHPMERAKQPSTSSPA